jgi:hypothetical protein
MIVLRSLDHHDDHHDDRVYSLRYLLFDISHLDLYIGCIATNFNRHLHHQALPAAMLFFRSSNHTAAATTCINVNCSQRAQLSTLEHYPRLTTYHTLTPHSTRSLRTPLAHSALHTPAHPFPDDRVASGITPLWKRKSSLAILSLARHQTVGGRLDSRTPSKNFANPTGSTTGCSCRQSNLTCVCVRGVLQLVFGLLYNWCLICSTSGFCFRLNDVACFRSARSHFKVSFLVGQYDFT